MRLNIDHALQCFVNAGLGIAIGAGLAALVPESWLVWFAMEVLP